MRKIIEKLPGNVWWKDKNLKYLGCNDRVLHVLGLSRKEFIGKTDHELWEESIANKLEEADLHVLKSAETINLEETIVEFDGRKATMLTNKSPLQDNQGHIIGILGTSTDITELKNTQLQLKEAEERLAGIKALSASIAHELRTPLTAIKFGLSGAEDYLPALVNAYNLAKENSLNIDPIQPKHLQILSSVFDNIRSEVRYSETIINMILMNVKQQEVSPANFKVYSISECIDEAIRRYPFKVNEEGLVSWNSEISFNFLGDKTLMVHVLFNLFKNSLYYIHAAKKGVIEIWCEKKGSKNVLYFKDTGKGIPSDALPRLFEKFYTTTHHGTGLGLAFCKMVMTGFDGSINCTSEYGEFTQFEMIFPNYKDAD